MSEGSKSVEQSSLIELDSRQVLAGILFLGLLVRVLLAIVAWLLEGRDAFFLLDSGNYRHLGHWIVSHGSFLNPEGFPELIRTPGYPLFLAPGYLLGYPVSWALTVQTLLSLGTIYLLFELARLLGFSDKQSLLACLFLALEPLTILYVNKVMSETLFTFLLVLFVYTFLLFIRNKRWLVLLVSIVSLVASTYVRPITLYFPFFMAPFLLYEGWRRGLLRKMTLSLLVVLLLWGGGVGGWMYRNQVVADYSGFSAVSDRTIYRYHAAATLAEKKGQSYLEMKRILSENEGDHTDLPRDRAIAVRAKNFETMKQRGIEIILENLRWYIPIHVQGMTRVMLDPGSVEYLRMLGLYPDHGGLLTKVVNDGILPTLVDLFYNRPAVFWTNLLMGVFLGIYLLGALAGLINYGFNGEDGLMYVFILLLIMYFWGLSGGPNSTSRFRHPMMPFICLWLGIGLTLVPELLGNWFGAKLINES